MLKIKLFGTLFAATLLALLISQVSNVKAQPGSNGHAITGPVTSPITGPCRPGWGFGDKNHCHSGPPGLNR